jgi:dTDP-4-dehydrorhamnose 3,5-epimerase-like enzyme
MAGTISISIDAALEASGPHGVQIPGLTIRPLVAHVDDRGAVTEIFRSSWGMASIRQWTVLTLASGVVRGPSVHRRHADAVVAVAGELQIGLRDLREGSPAFRTPHRLTLSGSEPVLVLIPPGVMHAFYAAAAASLVLVGNTHEYDPDDDIKCRWEDAPLDLDESVVGAMDERARPLDEVIAALRA